MSFQYFRMSNPPFESPGSVEEILMIHGRLFGQQNRGNWESMRGTLLIWAFEKYTDAGTIGGLVGD